MGRQAHTLTHDPTEGRSEDKRGLPRGSGVVQPSPVVNSMSCLDSFFVVSKPFNFFFYHFDSMWANGDRSWK